MTRSQNSTILAGTGDRLATQYDDQEKIHYIDSGLGTQHIQEQILLELRKLNFQLSALTGIDLFNEDLSGERG